MNRDPERSALIWCRHMCYRFSRSLSSPLRSISSTFTSNSSVRANCAHVLCWISSHWHSFRLWSIEFNHSVFKFVNGREIPLCGNVKWHTVTAEIECAWRKIRTILNDNVSNFNDQRRNWNEHLHIPKCPGRNWMHIFWNWMKCLRKWAGKPILQ